MGAEKTPLLLSRHTGHLAKMRNSALLMDAKGSAMLIVWVVLVSISKSALEFLPSELVSPFGGVHGLISFSKLLFPIGGLIADVWFGRYRVIVGSVWICSVAVIISIIAFVMAYFEIHKLGTVVTVYISSFLFVVGTAGFLSNIISFNVDQLMGAPAERLSAMIYWTIFGEYLARLSVLTFIRVLGFKYMKSTENTTRLLRISANLTVIGTAVIIILITNFLFKHWLDRTHQHSNSIKLIFNVLNYARKNKHPRNRSALTYWENDNPPRLDMGKIRYGGPFSEEEVENVKTILKMLPVYFPLLTCSFAFDPIEYITFAHVDSNESFLKYMLRQDYFPFLALLFLILLHLFLIQPFFHQYIPTMLKRIGLGYVFVFFTILSYIVLVLINQLNDPVPECPLSPNEANTSHHSLVDPPGYKWVVIPHIFCGISFFYILVSSLEFVVAQSPKQMQGLMVGLWFAFLGVGEIVNDNMWLPFTLIKSSSLGCMFYCYLTCSVIVLACLMIFLIFVKHYKLRIRDYTVPVYQIAEDIAERYLD